ncbi:hypothetical protein BX616_010276 [Lobosporangium transversale]|nr:hypothetical protein BX616_010276 [Lobosporangium transversale]
MKSDLSNLGLDLHYVELDVGHTVSSDLVLYDGFKPHHIINVSYGDNGTWDRTKKIHSYALNANGTHAATLCFTEDGQGIIELWSLDTELPEELQDGTTKRHSTLIAQGHITSIKVSRPDLISISMSVAASGKYIVIHSIEPVAKLSALDETSSTPKDPENTILCRILSYFPSTVSKDILSPRELHLDEACDGLRGFRGYGKFHLCSLSDDQGNTSEYYITCDGYSISIYSTNIYDKWSLINTLDMTAEQNLEAASIFITNLRGNRFAWTGSRNVVSFWDIVRMKQLSYIKVTSGVAGSFVGLSGDGSLAAISVKRCISIYETASGMKLGDYTEGLGDDKQFGVVMDHENFMIFDQDPPDDPKHRFIECKIIRACDMKSIRSFSIRKDYSLSFPNPLKDQIFVYREGPVMDVIKIGIDAIFAPSIIFSEEDLESTEHHELSREFRLKLTSTSGVGFILTTKNDVLSGGVLTVVTITRVDLPSEQHHFPALFSPSLSDSTASKKQASLKIPLGPSHIVHSCMFLPATSRLVLMTGHYMQVWRLIEEGGSDSPEVARLELVWALQEEADLEHRMTDPRIYRISSAMASKDGTQFALTLLSKKWYKELKESSKKSRGFKVKKLTYPHSSLDNLGTSEEIRISHGTRNLIDMYADGDAACQEAVIQYLKALVRPSSQNPVSCISTLCEVWTYENRNFLEQIMKALLPPTKITWIPDSKAIAAHKLCDPLKKLFQIAEAQPAVISVAKVIMDYCVSHANSSRNLSFLTPIFGSMKQVMDTFPEQALDCIERIAYIPATERSYIIDNHKIAYPPMFRLKFWQSPSLALSEIPDPIMQLHVVAKPRDPKNDLFTDSVFMASFDALWLCHDDTINAEDKETGHDDFNRGASLPEGRLKPTHIIPWTTRWKSMYQMFLLKLQLKNRIYVKPHNFTLDFFDNPAITALVTYKWNTIGFPYWLSRFAFQCIYYILVLVVAFMQVYYSGEDHAPLIGLFIMIIVMSVIFIWLETLQAYQDWKGYKKSIYNSIDILAFLIPMAAGIHQLVIIFNDDQAGNTRLVSFSVLAVFLHMLFELRINQMVCIYVAIIQQATEEIQVFFVIFAAGLIAFTVGMLHLLHACPTGGCERAEDEGFFPIQFFGALSATYFMLGGRYDPVDSKFTSEDWAFHIMMMLFFFFTVILMLNVLIALINVAFIKGDGRWRLIWFESRLRYIEAAENMSYHIPDYRKTYDCFPREIYFTATARQMKAYQEKLDASADKEMGKRVTNVDARVEQLQEQLQELKELLLQSTRQQR